jgi:genome maintenance exonuclease 1
MFNHIHHDFPKLLQENVDGTRCYVTPDGKKYPSVTTVLSDYGKEELNAWKARVGEKEAARVSRKATTRGTAVHAAIEHYLHNKDISELEMLPNVKEMFVKMKQELVKLNNIHCLETKLFSHELRLAGTVDCIAEHNGVLSVIDFKTSRRLKKKESIQHYFMQGAAYAHMFREMTNLNIQQVVILIGVEGVPFCQTMKVDPNDHIDELKKYITQYENRLFEGVA